MSPHTDPGALLKLAEEMIAFFNFINEPPQYEDQRMVRDYRHELAQLWMPLHTKINAALAASHGREGGEAVAWRWREISDADVPENWHHTAKEPRFMNPQHFVAEPLYALSPPVKTGGEATNGARANDPGCCMGLAPEDQCECFESAIPKLTAAGNATAAQASGDRGDLTKIAAECHRAKWQFDFKDEIKIGMPVARRALVTAFNELHRIGDMALKLRDASPVPSAHRGGPNG